jgi:hypothetical protein
MEKIKKLVYKISSINEETEISPGANREETKRILYDAGIPSNQIVLDILSWANGIEGLDAFIRLMNVDSILELSNTWKELKKEMTDCDVPFEIPNTVVPLIDVNGNTQYGIDTIDNSVFMVDMECDINQKICSDYELMINAISKAIDTKVFTFDKEHGCFDCDDVRWQDLADEFNIKIIDSEKDDVDENHEEYNSSLCFDVSSILNDGKVKDEIEYYSELLSQDKAHFPIIITVKLHTLLAEGTEYYNMLFDSIMYDDIYIHKDLLKNQEFIITNELGIYSFNDIKGEAIVEITIQKKDNNNVVENENNIYLEATRLKFLKWEEN